MGTKRILLFIIASIVLVLGIVGIYVYNRLNRQSRLPESIPGEAQAVVYINAKVLAKKFILDRDTGIKVSRLKKIPYLAHIKKMDETGIDLLSDAAIIQYKGMYYGLLALEDARKLETCIAAAKPGLFGPVIKNNSYSTVLAKDSFILAWNNRLLVFIPKSKTPAKGELIKEMLTVKKERSFALHDKFVTCRKDDAAIWFYAKRADLKIFPPAELKGYVEWDKDINISMTENISAAYPGRLTSYSEDMNSISADTGRIGMVRIFEALTLAHLPEQADQLKGIDLAGSRKTFALKGQQEVRNESITYAYDENFNKQKVVTVTTDTVNAAVLYVVDKDQKFTVITNAPGTAYDEPSGFSAHFNQDMFQPLYPVAFPYEVSLIQSTDKGWNEYLIQVKIGSMDQITDNLLTIN